MRFNFISESGDGVGFAIKLAQQDEDVRVWIRDSQAKSIGDGLIPKVGDLEDLLTDAETKKDVFIFDVTGNGIVADDLRSKRFPVLGGSILADRLERDREFGLEVMEEAGIQTPESHSFDSFEKAKKFVKDNPDTRFVYKPSKQLGDLSPSHVSHDSEDLIEFLDNIKKEVELENPEFVLQEFVEGPTLSTELWFQNGELVEPLTNHTFERKELMNEDLGPSGGCTGNIVWFCEGCPVCDAIKGLEPRFKRESFNGMVDINVIVSESGTYGLEFTPRFGYDASPTLLWEIVNEDLARFFADAASGQLEELDLSEGYGAGLRISIPPWPSEKFNAEEGVPIRGIKEDSNHVYWYNVKKNDKGLISSGAWGILALLTGSGSDIRKAFISPYKMAKEIRVKDCQYRTDLVEAFEQDLAKLEAIVSETKVAK